MPSLIPNLYLEVQAHSTFRVILHLIENLRSGQVPNVKLQVAILDLVNLIGMGIFHNEDALRRIDEPDKETRIDKLAKEYLTMHALIEL